MTHVFKEYYDDIKAAENRLRKAVLETLKVGDVITVRSRSRWNRNPVSVKIIEIWGLYIYVKGKTATYKVLPDDILSLGECVKNRKVDA